VSFFDGEQLSSVASGSPRSLLSALLIVSPSLVSPSSIAVLFSLLCISKSLLSVSLDRGRGWYNDSSKMMGTLVGILSEVVTVTNGRDKVVGAREDTPRDGQG
jgi:hypothetical protein